MGDYDDRDTATIPYQNILIPVCVSVFAFTSSLGVGLTLIRRRKSAMADGKLSRIDSLTRGANLALLELQRFTRGQMHEVCSVDDVDVDSLSTGSAPLSSNMRLLVNNSLDFRVGRGGEGDVFRALLLLATGGEDQPAHVAGAASPWMGLAVAWKVVFKAGKLNKLWPLIRVSNMCRCCVPVHAITVVKYLRREREDDELHGEDGLESSKLGTSVTLSLDEDLPDDPSRVSARIGGIVMQLFPHRDLLEAMRSGRLSLSRPRVLSIARCIARYLVDLHSHNKLHRDIK